MASPILNRSARRAEPRNGLVLEPRDGAIVVEASDGWKATAEDFEALVGFIDKPVRKD
ncbi:hypothetical protein [Rhodovulum adriaticum]|nr:hypothetical protein [Rhodovulum adriaticum]